MKKLMVLLACGLGMAAANAATVTWNTGTAIKGVDSGANLDAGKLTMYVWEIASKTDYDKLTDAASIFALDKSTAAYSGTNSKSGVAVKFEDKTTYGKKDPIYTAVLIVQNDAGTEYYTAQKMSVTVDEMDSGIAFNSLGKNIYGTTTAVTWTAVPEPTSGLLLLLGVAGLALKRKRA